MKKRDVVALEGLVVDCVVGVYPHERDTPPRCAASDRARHRNPPSTSAGAERPTRIAGHSPAC